MITGYWHAGVSVSDMERSLVFYRDLLGLEQVSDRVVRTASVIEVTGTAVDAIRVCMLKVPGEDLYLELLEYGAPGPLADRNTIASEPGTGHVCFYVDDLVAVWNQLHGVGVESPSGGPVDFSERTPGTWCIYLRDPDGFLVELFEGPRYPLRTLGERLP
ncbi:MAG: VOC family protein [Pseudolysinimonas sp.]